MARWRRQLFQLGRVSLLPTRFERVEGFGQPRLAQRQGRRLAYGSAGGLEEFGDDRRRPSLGVNQQETVEALGQDIGVAVAEAGHESKDQARALPSDGPERHGRRHPHVLRGIRHGVDQQGQAARTFGSRQGDEGRCAQRRGGVLAPSPDRFELHVARCPLEYVRIEVADLVEEASN